MAENNQSEDKGAKMYTWSCYANGALLFTLSGGFLVLVGYVMPYWVTFDYQTCPSNQAYWVSVYVNIWYNMVCDMDNPTYCRMEGIPMRTSNSFNFSQLTGCNAKELSVTLATGLGGYRWWLAIQIMMSIGLGLIFVAAIMVEVWRCGGYGSRKSVAVMSGFLLAGGAAFLTVVVIVSVGLASFFGVPDYKMEVATFPWSVLTSGIGSILVLVGGCLALAEVCKWKEPNRKYQQGENEGTNLRMTEGPGPTAQYTQGFNDHESRGGVRAFSSGTYDGYHNRQGANGNNDEDDIRMIEEPGPSRMQHNEGFIYNEQSGGARADRSRPIDEYPDRQGGNGNNEYGGRGQTSGPEYIYAHVAKKADRSSQRDNKRQVTAM